MAAQASAAAVAKQSIINPRSSTSFNSHTTLKMLTHTTYKHYIDSEVDSHLKQFITIRPPFEVFKPMHHLVFSTPKNITPALCVAGCEAVGGRLSDALPAAAALHLVHVAASAHENLLLGNFGPKLKYSFGSNIELLTGDGLVPLAFELLAMAGQNRHTSIDADDSYSDRVVRVIAEISRAIGSQGAAGAQHKRYACAPAKSTHNDLSPHVNPLNGCGAACGAILGGGSEEKIEILRRCGTLVGVMSEGILNGDGNGVTQIRDMAMKELEGLDVSGGIEFMSCLVDSVLCDD